MQAIRALSATLLAAALMLAADAEAGLVKLEIAMREVVAGAACTISPLHTGASRFTRTPLISTASSDSIVPIGASIEGDGVRNPADNFSCSEFAIPAIGAQATTIANIVLIDFDDFIFIHSPFENWYHD